MNDFRDKIKFMPNGRYKTNSQKAKDFPYYNMYEQDNSFVGRINPKYETRQNKWLKGVSCFVVNKKGQILLERRVSKGLTPGKIDLVSGHLDKEENSIQAMERELQEEIGIKVKKENQLRTIGTLPLIFDNPKGKRKFKIEFFLCNYNNETINIQKDEVDNIFWLPMDEAFELIRQGKTKFPYNEQMEEIFQKVNRSQNIGKERE